MFLLTALIISLVFINLDVASVAASPGDITFDRDLTMTFDLTLAEERNQTWISTDDYFGYTTGNYSEFYNATGDNITRIAPSNWYTAWVNASAWYYPPETYSWWYIWDPIELYNYTWYRLYPMPILFFIDNVTEVYLDNGTEYVDFHIDKVWHNETVLENGVNLTSSVEYVGAEMCVDGLRTEGWYNPGYDMKFYNITGDSITNISACSWYYADVNTTTFPAYYAPYNNSWWTVKIPFAATDAAIFINNVTWVNETRVEFHIDQVNASITNATTQSYTGLSDEFAIAELARYDSGWYYACWNVSAYYPEPQNGSSWYIYWPERWYALWDAITISNVTYDGLYDGWNYSYFYIERVFSYWFQADDSYTAKWPVAPADYVEGELMFDNVTLFQEDPWWNADPTYTAFVDFGTYDVPYNDTWWYIIYPTGKDGTIFHIDDTGYVWAYTDMDGVQGNTTGTEEYRYPHIDQVYNTTGGAENVSLVTGSEIAWDGVGAIQLISNTTVIGPNVTHAESHYLDMYNATWANITEISTDGNYTAWCHYAWGYLSPQVGSWGWANLSGTTEVNFVIDSVSDSFWGSPYGYYVNFTIGEVYDANWTYTNVTLPTPGNITSYGVNDGWLYNYPVVTNRWYVTEPSTLQPEVGTWWNITTANLTDVSIQIGYSETETDGTNFFHIDQVRNSSGLVSNATVSFPFEKKLEAALAEGPTVNEIGSWYNVAVGGTPTQYSCWTITSGSATGAKFLVDKSGEGIFHIDEVLNATGDPGPISLPAPEASIDATEFIPKIWIEANETHKLATYNVAVKTDYPFHAWSYEFTLTWDANILTCNSVANGDLIAGGSADFNPGVIIPGKLSLTGAYFDYSGPTAPQTHGPGTLATVEFTADEVGCTGPILGPETRLVGVTEEGNGTKYNAIDNVVNEIVDSTVRVRVQGNVDGDGDVDGGDGRKIQNAMFSVYPQARFITWNTYPTFTDVDGDGDVDGGDMRKCQNNMFAVDPGC